MPREHYAGLGRVPGTSIYTIPFGSHNNPGQQLGLFFLMFY